MGVLNYYLVYEFIKKLTRPFTEWEAFKKGVIDKDGKVLVKKKERTWDQKSSYTLFDNLVRNIKLVLVNLPGGMTRLGSFAAALYLIKEHQMFIDTDSLNESIVPEVDIDAVGRFVEDVVNSANGIDSTGFMSKDRQKQWTAQNAKSRPF